MVTSRTIDEVDISREREDMKKLEAIFFVSGRFLSMPELVSLSELNPIIIKNLIDKLQERYEKENSAIEIIERNEMWKMDAKQEYHSLVNKLATGNSEFTKAEQETLAIIAFKQPMKQSILVKIRGNKAYDHIKKFVELNLVKKKKSGHTSDLSLSDEFYDYFSANEGSSLNEISKKMESGKELEN